MGKPEPTRLKLTSKAVEGVEAGKVVYDARIPNLGLRVSPKGRRTFFLLAKNGYRLTLGTYPKIKLESARMLAEQRNFDIANGLDPRAKRQKSASELTWELVWQDYSVNRKNKRKDSNSRTLKNQWATYLSKWSSQALSTIEYVEAWDFILELRKRAPIAANRVHRQRKAMLNRAAKEMRWEGKNPFEFSQLSEKDRKRKRAVSQQELARLFSAFDELPNQDIADLFRSQW